MPRLIWGAAGERVFEAGADRGVLYLPGVDGVPWSGITSVQESPNGGDPQPYYIDGVKYLNLAVAEEFMATISAFSSPAEFAACDGTVGLHHGLFATQQPRRQFDLSYRTKLGNDLEGLEYGYKIHLVYNALAAPSERSHQTLSDTTTPLVFSWPISTVPVHSPGIKSTAHFVVDSRTTPPGLLRELEDILYGSDEYNSSMPTISELVELFASVGPLARTNYISDPLFTTPYTVWDGNGNTAWSLVDGKMDIFFDQGPVNSWVVTSYDERYWAPEYWSVNDPMSVSYYVENIGATTVLVNVNITDNLVEADGPTVELAPGQAEWVRFENYIITDGLYLKPTLEGSFPDASHILVSQPIVEKASSNGTFFHGGMSDDFGVSYSWEDVENFSRSFMYSWL